jgi:SAM-dependent methyltransferase
VEAAYEVLMSELPFNPWIQRLCPSPRRYAQELIIRHNLKTGLDIGCGENSMLTPLRRFGFRSTGVDGSEMMLASARERNLHDEYILGDFLKLNLSRQFDVVVMTHVLEHFTREEGLKLLDELETIASRLLYIETPHGFVEQGELDGNLFQRHRSGWHPRDFEARGYSTFGSSPRIRRPIGQRQALPEFLLRFVERAMRWYYFRRPGKSGDVAAIRLVDENNRVCKV